MEGRYTTGKRSLDDDDSQEVRCRDRKKLKTEDSQDLLSLSNNIQDVKDAKKWKSVPSIVYELLALFKKSENTNPTDDCNNKEKQEKNADDTKEELNVLQNENPKEDHECVKINDAIPQKIPLSNVEFLNTKESDHLIPLKTTVEDSTHSLENVDFFVNETKNLGVQKKNSLDTSIIPVKNVEKNIVQKEHKGNEANRKTSVLNILPPSTKMVSHGFTTSQIISIKSFANEASGNTMDSKNPSLTKSVSNTLTPSQIISNTSFSDEAIWKTMDSEKPIKSDVCNTFTPSQINNISSRDETNGKMTVSKNLSYTESVSSVIKPFQFISNTSEDKTNRKMVVPKKPSPTQSVSNTLTSSEIISDMNFRDEENGKTRDSKKPSSTKSVSNTFTPSQITSNTSSGVETNGKLVVPKKALPTKNVSNTFTPLQIISNMSFKDETDGKTRDSSKKPSSTKSVSNTFTPSQIISNKTSSSKMEMVSIMSTQNDVSITEKHFLSEEKEKEFDFFMKLCINGISKIPATKSPPCICKYCVYVDNLPLDQSVVMNLFTPNNGLQQNNQNHEKLHSGMYSSNPTVTDCSVCASKGIYTTNDCICVWDKNPQNMESPKDVWVSELTSLIRKNERFKAKAPETNVNNASKSLTGIKKIVNKVCKTAKRIKSHLPLCKNCKRSKPYSTYVCKCNKQHVKKGKYNEIPALDSNHHYSYKKNWRY